ncbi:hypothetical protein GYM75_10145 [Gilliamella sp. ESL0441]|uniref:hypothetical protein n=1 Tax=Gilliamella sp. ESL0441 TaxID=2704654 RepID=UPI001C6A6257|nr:hypothetical protein [Gilliamella sp. ESL0441]QYN45183.1 hypothetical protein GYM75_10145 [Gilliamella sp. ESL0441]
MSLTEAQKRAMKKQAEKRIGMPKIPCTYITDEENDLLIEMAKIYGSKKAALIRGLRLLKIAQKDKNYN